MCRPEFERKQAAKNTKENLELVCYLTGILIALVLAIYVAVKAYSFIVGYFSP